MFSGPRVRLRAFETSDGPCLHHLLNEPELLGRRYLDEDRDPLALEQVADLLSKWIKSDRELHLAITDGETLLGFGLMDHGWEPLAPFVSVVIDPAHQRRGYGTEALDLLLRHLFGTGPALAAETWVDDWNVAGLAFANKNGFLEAGRSRREGIHDGMYFDAVGLDLTRAEWEASRGH